MKKLDIFELNKSFEINNRKIPVLQGVDFDIEEGEFIVIVGQSGCGKSTLLKIILGIETATEGFVLKDGEKITGPDTDRGMIFQEHRLFPWKTIKDNILIGKKSRNSKELEKELDYYLDLVKLSEFKEAYPKQLSGGMSQRAAIARALINKPEILLLDEPFGALDALTKIELQKEITKIWKEAGMTMIMVTHDIEEAVYLADRVIVMDRRPCHKQ